MKPTSSLRIDFETRSPVDLRKTGVYPYAEDPNTGIWCMAWAFDTEEPEIWTPPGDYQRKLAQAGAVDLRGNSVFGDEGNGYVTVSPVDPSILWKEHGLPARIVDHIEAGGEIRAWNAQFERVIWREIMQKRYGAPVVPLDQWVCSAAEAAAMSLPRALGQAASVMGVEEQKDDKGYRQMLQMSRPRDIIDGEIIWWDEAGVERLAQINEWKPTKIARELGVVRQKLDELLSYCKQDVRTESSIVNSLRRLTAREREIYLLDQRVNDRGIKIDRELIVAAQGIAADGVERANLVMREITGGSVTNVMKHGDLTNWLRTQGVAAAGVSKAAIRELLEQDLAPAVREALETRADAGRTSIAKLKSLLEGASSDDRLRGLLLYHGAGTGRWTGRGVQPHNFPRGEVDDIESFIPYVLEGKYGEIDIIAHPIIVVSSMLRSMLTAEEGHDLLAADYSAIEARVLNWVAGQEDVLQMFRDGIDVYKYNATRLYKIPMSEVKKFPHRQTGKFQELGCGFQMGAAKAVSAAKDVYGLTITEDEAKEIVGNYRETHDRVVQYWRNAEDACIEAVSAPGTKVRFGARKNVTAIKIGGYLLLVLPSGRALHYAAPKIVDKPVPWGGTKPSVTFSGVNSFTRQWQRMALYGGLITENIVQAVARDLMAEGMMRGESRGYDPILSVHDEVVSEVPHGFGSVQEFEKLLCELPTWAEGCPVAAEGWRGFRYRK